ncbi:hypothetical protein [Enhygromyxa salina]|uniref:Lipoprotein n=1 Tax=Enhygromyxa salina TaxID=215803 RepID=A0A2S9XTX6_9BACT|nr:hypothetical protein [Enhygromyxa salina]PRP96180.1 hypothetical protein ENSA7_69940 [Enhygromyxa salina]
MSRAPLASLLVLPLVFACAPPPPPVTPEPIPEPVTKIPAEASPGLQPASESAPGIATILEERALLLEAFGVPALEDLTIAPDNYEVRVFYRRPERRLALRLWTEAGALRGAAWVWWTAAPESDNSHYVHMEIDDWVDCPEAVRAGESDVEGCRVHFPAGHTWDTALANFEAHELWTLRGVSELGSDPSDPDFYEVLLVELRDSARLRRYYHRDCEEQGSREADVALALTQALWDVFAPAEWDYERDWSYGEDGELIKARRPLPD